MTEKLQTLLGISEVQVYGEKVSDMSFKDAGTPHREFVRIFGFGFEGGYYSVDTPVIMLLEMNSTAFSSTNVPKDVIDSFGPNVKVWTVDKSDKAIRLDEMNGTVGDILLDVELSDGAGGRVSGGRVSGGRVSGGRISGGRVSGGRVSGGRVSGGKSD